MNQSKVTELLKPTVESLGYILWGCEYIAQGKHSVLRLYIDKEDGILMEDCTAVSRQVSQVLDVEDPIQSNYSLEVSSPGIDRPLFESWQYAKYQDQEVSIKLYQAINRKKSYKGFIQSVKDNVLQLKSDNELIDISFDLISRANLVF